MKPTVAALVAALVSGTAMYGVGAMTSDRTAVVESPGVMTADATPYAATRTALRSSNVDVVERVSQPRVVRVARSPETVVVQESKPRRSWGKTALIIGGSAASGAGVGAVIGGKKGAITGAAIGGGAASIYEAIRRQ